MPFTSDTDVFFLDNVTERGSTSLFYFTGVWEEFLILVKWTIVFYLFTYVTSGHSHFWSFCLSLKVWTYFLQTPPPKHTQKRTKTGNILALKEHLYVLRSSPDFFVFWGQVQTSLCFEVKSILSYVLDSDILHSAITCSSYFYGSWMDDDIRSQGFLFALFSLLLRWWLTLWKLTLKLYTPYTHLRAVFSGFMFCVFCPGWTGRPYK